MHGRWKRDNEVMAINEKLEALVEEINRLDHWELEACKELCKRAGLESDWENADADTFEEVIYHAAEILGVVIG